MYNFNIKRINICYNIVKGGFYMDEKKYDLSNVFYDSENNFMPLTDSDGNINGKLSNLRNTYMEAERQYFSELLSYDSIRERFMMFLDYSSDALFASAVSIQEKLETGMLESKEELEMMKMMSPQKREARHMKNLEEAEGLMCLLFAAARDKVKIKELVKTYSHSRSR